MVKVLENQVVDLDLLPGKEQQELKAKLQEQLEAQGGKVSWEIYPVSFFCWKTDEVLFVSSGQLKAATDNLPAEQKQQVEGYLDGASKVATGVAGTAGGAVKGVLDTAGNTVSTWNL